MAGLETREYVYFTTVRSACAQCGTAVPARVFFRDGAVWQERLCPHPGDTVRIAGDEAWYLREALAAFPMKPPLPQAQPPRRGCPQDCGPCAWHAGGCESVELLADCVEEARCAIDWLAAQWGSIDSVTIFTRCSEVASGLPGRVTLKAGDAHAIAAPANPVALEVGIDHAGEALARLGETTGLTVRADDLPVDEIARRVCAASGGRLAFEDFRPEPPAHPLCRLRAGLGGRPVRAHSYMRAAAFDCARAMLCPEWTLVRPGALAPACVHRVREED